MGLAAAGFAGLHGIELRYDRRLMGRRQGINATDAAHLRAMGVPAGMEQNPEESIKAAVKYIAATANSFRRIPDPDERIKFILAAYNAGIGHITDAMALAEKYGKNKYIWDNNVADYILLKSNEEYFNDPLCKNGYFRGVETFKFVKEVISRGEVYKSKIKH